MIGLVAVWLAVVASCTAAFCVVSGARRLSAWLVAVSLSLTVWALVVWAVWP